MLKDKSFIKEICVKLNFRVEMINDVFTYFEILSQSKTHSNTFAEEVSICTCIYLSSKINENFRRIRDIINVMYFCLGKHEKIKELTAKPDLSNEEKKQLKLLTNDNYIEDPSIMVQMIPNLTLEKYSLLRDEILKAEQQLLRILNYEFKSKSKEIYIMLVNYCDLFEFNNAMLQVSWNILSDVYETTNLVENKKDILVICSILYLTKRWDEFYAKNQNIKVTQKSNINNNLDLKKETQKDEDLEIFSKSLNVDYNEVLGIIEIIK